MADTHCCAASRATGAIRGIGEKGTGTFVHLFVGAPVVVVVVVVPPVETSSSDGAAGLFRCVGGGDHCLPRSGRGYDIRNRRVYGAK